MAHDPSYQARVWKKHGASEEHFDDTCLLVFGDDEDLKLQWDGTDFHLDVTPTAATLNIGASGYVANIVLTGTLSINGNSVTWAAAAPTGSVAARQGDVCWNTGATGGGSPGWVCSASGTPGTWKTMANLGA